MSNTQKIEQWHELMRRIKGLGFEYRYGKGREVYLPEYHMTIGWASKPKAGLTVIHDGQAEFERRFGLRAEEIL